MKIAVFSDIHGNLQALEAIIKDINNNSFDSVICLGDVIGIGPRPKECLELLLNSNIMLLAGNHDLYYKDGIEIDDKITEKNEIEHHHWVHECIKDIPKEKLNWLLFKELYINGKKIMFQHYILSDNKYPFKRLTIDNMEKIEEYCENMDCDYLIIGHEHRGFIVTKNNKTIYCLKSSGCVKDNKTFYTILDIDDKGISFSTKELEFDRDGLIRDIKSYNYPDRDFIGKVMFGIQDL